MARVCRLKSHLDGQAYHVMHRTVRQAFLFDDDVSKEWIYQEILALAEIYTVDLHAIAVMSNHYHMVLTMLKPVLSEKEVEARFTRYQRRLRHPQKWHEWRFNEWATRLTDLSRFMQDLNRSIATYVNGRDRAKGPLWGGRFKSTLLDDGDGFLRCMAYVEMNPVKAGLCQRPSEYRWCSMGRYHGGGRRAAGVNFPKIKGFDYAKTTAQRQKAFRMFLDHLADREHGLESNLEVDVAELQKALSSWKLDEMADWVFRRTEWAWQSLALGSESYCRAVIQRFKLQSPGCNQPFTLGSGLCNTHMRAGPHSFL